MSTAKNPRDAAIRRNLEQAIKTMREAVESAERSISGNKTPDPKDVLHAFTWGLANASSSIMGAMGWREVGHEEALFHAHRNPDPNYGMEAPSAA